jgi:hypothetical protein
MRSAARGISHPRTPTNSTLETTLKAFHRT